MKIRNYSNDDYSSIVSIYNVCKLDELQFEEEPFLLLPLEQDQQRLSATLESEIVVYEDEEILGYAAFFESELRALFVLPSDRGKGIGKALLAFVLSKVGEGVSLQVVKSNAPAVSLYLAYGFTITGESVVKYNNKSVLVCKMQC